MMLHIIVSDAFYYVVDANMKASQAKAVEEHITEIIRGAMRLGSTERRMFQSAWWSEKLASVAHKSTPDDLSEKILEYEIYCSSSRKADVNRVINFCQYSILKVLLLKKMYVWYKERVMSYKEIKI